MTLRESPALLQALALLDNPRGPRPGQGDPLPVDVIGLLRIAAGDQERLGAASHATGLATTTLREAAVFYIQQVLFAPGSDSYRSLGVDPRAADDQIREHHRWLLRWLHPDRNSDPWEVVYAERVSRAWQDLRTVERRQRHDHEAAASLPSEEALPRAVSPAAGRAPPPMFSPAAGRDLRAATPNLRWLPSLVFGALAVSAVLAIVLLYAMHSFDARQSAGIAAATPQRPPPVQAADAEIQWPADTRVDGPSQGAAIEATVKPASPVVAPDEDFAQPAPTIARANPPEASVTEASVTAAAPTAASMPTPPPAHSAAPALVAAPAAVPKPARILPAAVAAAPVRRSALPPVIGEVPAMATPPAMAPTKARIVPDSSSPALPAARIASAVTPHAGLDDRTAYGLLGTFSDIYRQGDIARLELLLTDDARSARGGRDSLVAEYGALFASSERRRLTVSNVSWLDNGQTASIIASFEASVVPRRGGRPRLSRGDLRLDLRMDEGQWRIYRLAHDEHRG